MHVGVYIGRFQPFHTCHADILDGASLLCDQVVVFVGVPEQRSTKNPFMFEQIDNMIKKCFPKRNNITIVPLMDNPSDEVWKQTVKDTVASIQPDKTKVHLFGYRKDASSGYLNWFPEYSTDHIQYQSQNPDVSGTYIRHLLYQDFSPVEMSWRLLTQDLFSAAETRQYVVELTSSLDFLQFKQEYRKGKQND
jgi:bifunctional NMN adenylyltransferase/nudix hydrolase